MSPSERTEKLVIAVESEPERSQVLSSYLALYGVRVSVYASPDEALRDSPDKAPDVVVANLENVPSDQSWTRLWDKSSGRRTLFVALGDESDSERAASAGFDLFLPRPTDFETLAEIILNYDGG